jgi:hypothetical protein
MGLGATNKRKGSSAERYYAKFFRELGFTFCETARFGSKKHDNAKIDLLYIPFNVQIKAGIQKNMNPGKELFMMASSITAMFPPEDEVFKRPCILFHYKQGKPGARRTPDMEIVYMSMIQFEEFNCYPETSLEYVYSKEFKFELDSPYKHIVGMTLDHFKQEVILKQYVTCQ